VSGSASVGGVRASSTDATRASIAPSRASTPTVSKLGANGITPASGMASCEGLNPTTTQLLAGTRTEPPVSVPSAKSHRSHATAEAEPLEAPPGTRSGARGLRGGVEVVLPEQAEGELVGDGGADQPRPRAQELLDDDRVHRGGRV
jgi:hypothetical protein